MSKRSSQGLLEKRLMAYSLVAGAVLANGAARAEVQKSSPGAVLNNNADVYDVLFGGTPPTKKCHKLSCYE